MIVKMEDGGGADLHIEVEFDLDEFRNMICEQLDNGAPWVADWCRDGRYAYTEMAPAGSGIQVTFKHHYRHEGNVIGDDSGGG